MGVCSSSGVTNLRKERKKSTDRQYKLSELRDVILGLPKSDRLTNFIEEQPAYRNFRFSGKYRGDECVYFVTQIYSKEVLTCPQSISFCLNIEGNVDGCRLWLFQRQHEELQRILAPSITLE